MRIATRKQPARRVYGVTLIETVAALALLGSLVALSFSSRSNINHQYRDANLKLLATQLADRQLQAWYDSPQGPPRRQAGRFDAQPEWTWRTSVINDPDLVRLELTILHLQVFAPGALRPEPGPVLTLELVVPVEDNRHG